MTLIANPVDSAQQKAVEAFFKALKVPYKKKEDESPYNPEFVAKIKQGEEDKKAGRYTIIKTEDLWK